MLRHAIIFYGAGRGVKRSAFGLAWDDKGVFYRFSEKPSFNESPDRVQVAVRLESEWSGFNG